MYVPLRVHGHHSRFAGVDSPSTLLERAAALGLDALALADIDNVAGHGELMRAASGGTVRAIVGAELTDEESHGGGRLVALARDTIGYENLGRILEARRACRPGEGQGRTGFDLVEQAIEHQRGLIFLADHPRLLLALYRHLPKHGLLAAISPASITSARPVRSSPSRPTGSVHAPVPARAIPVATMIDAARATGVATVAVPDVYCAVPGGLLQHRSQVARLDARTGEHEAPTGFAARPAHLLSSSEMCAYFAQLPDVPGDWPVDAAVVPPMVARTTHVASMCAYSGRP